MAFSGLGQGREFKGADEPVEMSVMWQWMDGELWKFA
jgi:hypothetical protein